MMKTRKKKILWCGEATFLETGYGKYGRELLSRLYNTGKYDIAEFASYGHWNDKRRFNIPWGYYGNMPDEGNQHQTSIYNSSKINQFGAWRFEEVALDFKPDIVMSITDPWMFEHHQRSPYFRLFKWVIMPTVDSEPQRDEWISYFLKADAVCTYSDYGKNVLERESNGLIKVKDVCPSGAHFDVFKPVANKAEHKDNHGLSSDVKIIGSIMRNQKRKLYPDLIESFKDYTEQHPEESKDVYLYLHVSHPDIGWDIADLVKRSGISRKILLTYICRSCRGWFPAFFHDSKMACSHCGQPTAYLPNYQYGVTEGQLAEIINLFDLYVQYSICMPKGEKVYVNGEWKNIENVKVGDVAYTHNHRWMPVKETMSREVNEDIVELSVYADIEKIRATDEHPVYGWFSKNIIYYRSLRESIGDNLQHNKELPKMEFVDISEVQEGDLIAYPIETYTKDIDSIEIGENNIELDKDFCKFLGLFAADGCWQKSTSEIRITCNKEEKENIELSKISFIKMGGKFKLRKYKDRDAVDVNLYCVKSRDWCKKFKKHEFKQLPEFVMYLPVEKQLNVLHGLMMGDGCYQKNSNVTTYTTISYNLYTQMKHLLRRCRINFNVNLKIRNDGNRKNQYRFEICGNGKIGDFERDTIKSTRNIYIGNYHMMQVKSVEKVKYEGTVYNFEVEEDNTYTSKIGVLHNCEGLGIPQIEAAACSVPIITVDYSAMQTVGQKLKADLVPIQKMFKENESGSYRVYPDNSYLSELIHKYMSMNETKRTKRGRDAMNACRRYFDWDNIAAKWEAILDELEESDTWTSSPALINNPAQGFPQGMSNDEFIKWCVFNVLGDPSRINDYMIMMMLRDLNYGQYVVGHTPSQYNDFSFGKEDSVFSTFNQQIAYQKILEIANVRNYWEQMRCGLREKPTSNFIENRKFSYE